jgi:amino acid adenylation domain-containing protein
MMFSIDKVGAPFDFGDVTIASLTTPKSYSNFELAVNVVDSGSDLVVECDYNADLYDGPTIRWWLSHYETLLRATVAQSNAALQALAILNDEAKRTILDEWNDTSVAFPEEKLLHRLFEAQVRRTPDDEAVVDRTERLSYRELDRRANQLSHHLRALGVQREALVGVCLERSVELVVTLLAVLKAGGAYLPLDPDYPPARLAFMVEDSRSSLIVTRRPLAGRLPTGGAPLLHLEDQTDALAEHPTTSPETDGTPEDLAYVIYTSGSTGRPNGVAIEHGAAVNHMLWMQTDLPLEPSDRVLQRTPISFDASVWEVYAPLLAGACLVMAPAEAGVGSVELTGAILEHEVTILQLVPSHARVFLREPDVESCTSLRRVLCGGEPLPAGLYRELRDRLGVRVFNLYGPTEACIDATWWPAVEAPAGGDAEPRLGTGWVPIGRPISNSRAYVLDSHREPVPVGAMGELYLAGEGLARGYLHRDELTAERFVSGSFGGGQVERAYRTGDLVRYRPDGNLEFVGRIDHQIKIRGFRIELGEIEAALAKHEEVREVAVVAREDRPDDKRLVAYVVPRADTLGLVERLKSKLRERLPDYMLPTHFVFLATLPLTPNGKVDKKSLPAPDPEAVATGTPHVAPRTPTESQIAAIWADALGIASPGIHDNFFDLGGHSLKAAQIVLELRSALRVDAAMRHLFEQPTIAGLAETMDVLAVADAGATAGGSEREEIEI